MDHLIRFRSLADSLTEMEFNAFISQMFSRYDRRQLLLSSLFHLFLSQISNREDSAPALGAIRMISAIIKARDDEKTENALNGNDVPPPIHPMSLDSAEEASVNENDGEDASVPLTIQSLPAELIGECASFLPFDGYHSLLRCGRSLFLGCTNPVTLRSVHRRDFLRCAAVPRDVLDRQHRKLLTLRNVSHFGVDVAAFLEMGCLHQIPLSRHSKSLSLYNSNQNTMRLFLATNSWDFGRIEMLKLQRYAIEWRPGADDVARCYADTFCDILSRFRNLRFLQLQGMDVLTNSIIDRFGSKLLDQSFVDTVFAKLEGFCLYETDIMKALFYDKLLFLTSDRLLSLHVDAPIAAPPKGFENLREICIYNANYSKIQCIIQSAKRLERVHLEFLANYIESASADSFRLEEVLVALWGGPFINSISIKMDRDIQIVKRALRRTPFAKRPQMRGKLYIKDEIEDAIEWLDIMSNILRDCAEDYIFKFRCVLTQNMVGRVSTFGCKVGDILRLTRTNNECALNGYRQQWLYPCVCNK